MSLLRHNPIEKTLLNCMHWIKKSQLTAPSFRLCHKPTALSPAHALTLPPASPKAHVRNSFPKRKRIEKLVNDRGINCEFAWHLCARSFTERPVSPAWGQGWKMGSKAEETGAPLRAFTHPAARRLRYLCRKPFIFSSHHVGWDPVLCAGSQKNPNFWRILKKKKKVKFLCQINTKTLIAATEIFAVVNKRVAIITTMICCCWLKIFVKIKMLKWKKTFK